MPQATVHSSLVADAWLAWHSMHKSMIWFRQIAQLSTTMSHAQSATAFHWSSISNWFGNRCGDPHLLDLKALLVALCAGTCLSNLGLGCSRGVRHVHVRHGVAVYANMWGCGELFAGSRSTRWGEVGVGYVSSPSVEAELRMLTR
jgi:hypothetical protein